MKNRIAAAVAPALIAALALAGCSSASDDIRSDPRPGPVVDQNADYNMADIRFAAMMIPHHEQAIEMSDIILAKTGVPPEVTDLAETIKAAQGPEIEQLEKWLDEWNDANGGAGQGGHGGHGGGMGQYGDMGQGGGMAGMLTDEQLDELEAADGATGTKLFLEQMIEHHEGAVDMAEEEVEDGKNADAIALAEDIVETQTAEIAQMQDLLTTL